MEMPCTAGTCPDGSPAFLASTPQPCMPCFNAVIAVHADRCQQRRKATGCSNSKPGNSGESQLVAVLSADAAACFSAWLTACSSSFHLHPGGTPHAMVMLARRCDVGSSFGRLLILLAALLQGQPPMHALLLKHALMLQALLPAASLPCWLTCSRTRCRLPMW